jgi:hypothetical protein
MAAFRSRLGLRRLSGDTRRRGTFDHVTAAAPQPASTKPAKQEARIDNLTCMKNVPERPSDRQRPLSTPQVLYYFSPGGCDFQLRPHARTSGLISYQYIFLPPSRSAGASRRATSGVLLSPGPYFRVRDRGRRPLHPAAFAAFIATRAAIRATPSAFRGTRKRDGLPGAAKEYGRWRLLNPSSLTLALSLPLRGRDKKETALFEN